MQFIKEKILGAIATGESVNRKLVLVVALGVAAVMAVLFTLNSPKPAPASSAPIAAPVVQLPDYYVHIVGEVQKPGIYDLPSDSRVFDVVFAAGGFTAKADQSSINMARAIGDGEQIVVLSMGSTPSISGGGGASPLISLNRGTQSDLENLPGVGPTLAARIIDWRLANGGFKKIDDLKKVSGIGNKLFQQIKAKASL
jgi:competence protein ComEA